MRRIPLLTDDMGAIRIAMNLEKLKDQTYWALLDSKWKGFLRGSDILRPTDDKELPWDPEQDTQRAIVTWEDIDTEDHSGCAMSMSWRQKPRKMDP